MFLAPHLILYYYTQLRYSLVVLYGFIASLSIVWFGLLIAFYFKIPNMTLIGFSWATTVVTWYFIFKVKSSQRRNAAFSIVTILSIGFLLIVPAIIHYGGDIYSSGDAIRSWNRWALELYENYYQPIDAAYPLLIPALLGFFYKLQGTSEVWWSVKLLFFVLPFTVMVLLLTFYYEKKDAAFIWFGILLYPYLISHLLFYGYVDMPVMVMGTLVLIVLYAAEIEKDEEYFMNYLIAALFLAGLTSIVKQAGAVFLIFVFLYIILNFSRVKSKKTILLVSVFSLLYLITFLIFYYQHTKYGLFGNIGHLKKLSIHKVSQAEDTGKYMLYLWTNFFSYPASPPFIRSLLSPLSGIVITPVLIVMGYLLYIFKPLRVYKTVGFLSAIFFIIGIALWILFFSYDARNSYWVKSFFVIFVGINFAYFTKRYRLLNSKMLLFSIFLIFIIYLILIGDIYTIKKQKSYQSHLGDYKTAQNIANILSNSNSCTKVYTTDHMIRYNTALFPLRKRTVPLLYLKDFKKYLEHNCSSGEYFLFRKQSVLNPDWKYVEKLEKKGYLTAIKNHENALLFYVPAGLKVPKVLLNFRTFVVELEPQKMVKDVRFSIDTLKRYNVGIVLSGWSIIQGSKIDKTKKYIVLKNELHTFIIDTTLIQRKDVTKVLHAKDLDSAGFEAKIYFDDFPKGEYKVYILLVDQNEQLWHVGLIKDSLKIGREE